MTLKKFLYLGITFLIIVSLKLFGQAYAQSPSDYKKYAEILFDNQIIKPKMSFSRTFYAKNANGYLGKNNIFSEFAYDYNGHTYWFSFSPNEVFKLNKIPKWINLSFGYGANGMIGEFVNKTFFRGNPIPEFKRYKQIYLSFDIDFSKIKSKSKFGKKLFNILSYIKVPLPTLEFSNKKLKGHLFYF